MPAGRTRSTIAIAATAAAVVAIGGGGAQAAPQGLPKQPVAYGTGGAAATISPQATSAAMAVLARGGNAVDAAVAAAAMLGVTEPFVAGPGGGGFFVYYRARDHRIFTIDSREKAPAGATPGLFLDASGTPLPFETAVESGLSVGVPGNVAAWDGALKRFGTISLARALAPAERVADRGFPLDGALVAEIAANQKKLARFPDSARLYLTPSGAVPAAGTVVRNHDLARTYRLIGRFGARTFYRGGLGRNVVAAAAHPATAPGAPPVAGSSMTTADLAAYTAPLPAPVSWWYRGYRLFGMAPPSSGGTTVGETMNILENFDLGGDRVLALHRYLEASRLAYADRGQYVGDPGFVQVPTQGLLSQGYANERAVLIGDQAAHSPVPFGDPWPFQAGVTPPPRYGVGTGSDGQHTTHLAVSDAAGNVVSYTTTIEQLAGSGITVPHRGFLLNNELTDFNFVPGTANSVAPGKRPRSSMAPTIVMRNGKVMEAIGSPGGSTIITTVLQTLLDQIDFGMTLPDAIDAPRASQRNAATTDAEPLFANLYGAGLQTHGQSLVPVTSIGIVAAVAFLPRGRVEAATEPWRGGGGSAMVQRPENPLLVTGVHALGR